MNHITVRQHGRLTPGRGRGEQPFQEDRSVPVIVVRQQDPLAALRQSNRRARPGCGRTFSVWLADKIRRLGLTTSGLYRAVADGLRAALCGGGCHLSDRTLLRIWKRFRLDQSNLRTALWERCPPPELPAEHRRAAQVLAHLQAAFLDAPCPIATFQQVLRTFFV